MDNSLLEKLAAATSDAEREAVVLENSLAILSPALRIALEAAAIPHWFDFTFLSALIGEEAADETYDQLVTLSFVDVFPGRGYAIHEATRNVLLNQLWSSNPHRFRALSGKAADYCLSNITMSGEENYWKGEEIYHRLVSDPEQGIERFQEMATAWANYEQSSLETIERIIELAREQVKSGRLTAKEGNLVRLWQSRLAHLYGHTSRAAELIAKVNLTQDTDTAFAADLADLQGDIHAEQNDLRTAEQAWKQAVELYTHSGRPFDRYLVQEKLRTHGLLDPQPDENAQPKTPPDSLTLKLLDNIEEAWINGVLKEVFKDDKQSLDLPMARGSESYLSGRLRLHRPGGLDQNVTGQGLSGLFEASGRSLLILGAPGSGKTITLLQLLNELIKQARLDKEAPVPLLFNLSSFGKFEGEIIDWLAEQAYNQYRLSRKATRAQIKSGRRFVLLLDGLDELPSNSIVRKRCISAINSFTQQTNCGLVACSRINDYQNLTLTLNMAYAIVLKPLNNHQIEKGLITEHQKQLTIDHWQLKEALRSPLLLTLFPKAFDEETEINNSKIRSITEWRIKIFSHYVAHMLPNQQQSSQPEESERGWQAWLPFLAQQMQQAGTTIFNIEDLQPTWLQINWSFQLYMSLTGLFFGITSMILTSSIDGLFDAIFHGLNGEINQFYDSIWLGIYMGISAGVAGLTTAKIQKEVLRANLSGIITLMLLFSAILLHILLLDRNFLSFNNADYIYDYKRSNVNTLIAFSLFNSLILGVGSLFGLFFLFRSPIIDLKSRLQIVIPTPEDIDTHFSVFGFYGLVLGLIVGVIISILVSVGELFPVTTYDNEHVASWVAGALFGCLIFISSLLLGFISSIFSTPPLDSQVSPGHGVIGSLRNGLTMTFTTSLIFNLGRGFLIFASGSDSLPVGSVNLILLLTLPIAFYLFGGGAWCQHLALRFTCYFNNSLPLHIKSWLQKMVEAGIMRRVGGGYIFIHRSLLEYFAKLEYES